MENMELSELYLITPDNNEIPAGSALPKDEVVNNMTETARYHLTALEETNMTPEQIRFQRKTRVVALKLKKYSDYLWPILRQSNKEEAERNARFAGFSSKADAIKKLEMEPINLAVYGQRVGGLALGGHLVDASSFHMGISQTIDRASFEVRKGLPHQNKATGYAWHFDTAEILENKRINGIFRADSTLGINPNDVEFASGIALLRATTENNLRWGDQNLVDKYLLLNPYGQMMTKVDNTEKV